VIAIVLLFFDGLLFGVAIKKAIVSVVLIVVGLALAGFIGLSIPFLSVTDIWTHVINIITSQAKHIGPILYGFPIFWIIGFAIGIWKG
jgi:hypothetical protein